MEVTILTGNEAQRAADLAAERERELVARAQAAGAKSHEGLTWDGDTPVSFVDAD